MEVINLLKSKRFHMHSNLHWADGTITTGVVGGTQDDGSFLFRLSGCNTYVRLVDDQSRAIYQPIDGFFGDGNYVDGWDNRPIAGTELINIIPEELDQGRSLEVESQS